MAQKAAQMLSSIDGREEVSNSDLELASVMVLAHRAVTMESIDPDQTDDNIQENKTSENDEGDEFTEEDQTRFLQDMIIEAVKAKLPDDLINRLKVTSKGISRGSKTGFGYKIKAKVRGRPRPSINGRPNGQERIEIFINTAKCSPMAKNEKGTTTKSRRNNNTSWRFTNPTFDNRSERVIIFVVDASGSAAVAD